MQRIPDRVQRRSMEGWQLLIYAKARRTHRKQLGHYARLSPDYWMLCLIGAQGRAFMAHRTGDRRLLEYSLAEMIAFVLVVAESSHVSLAEAMALKYPDICIYCFKQVCGCGENRPRDVEKKLDGVPRPELVARSPGDWQTVLCNMFGGANAVQGFHEVAMHAFSEFGELATALRHEWEGRHDSVNLREECADLFAWGVGIANLLDLNVPAMLYRYLRGDIRPYHYPKWRKPCPP